MFFEINWSFCRNMISFRASHPSVTGPWAETHTFLIPYCIPEGYCWFLFILFFISRGQKNEKKKKKKQHETERDILHLYSL